MCLEAAKDFRLHVPHLFDQMVFEFPHDGAYLIQVFVCHLGFFSSMVESR
jgi:hypothetical protein